jgi:hypothetical protein
MPGYGAQEMATELPPSFWENDLEMGLTHILKKHGREGFKEDWIAKRDNRQLGMLCSCLGLEPDESVKQRRAFLQGCNCSLSPYLLVEEFRRNKSKVATVDYASRVLMILGSLLWLRATNMILFVGIFRSGGDMAQDSLE